jgi:hypothetical protein
MNENKKKKNRRLAYFRSGEHYLSALTQAVPASNPLNKGEKRAVRNTMLP